MKKSVFLGCISAVVFGVFTVERSIADGPFDVKTNWLATIPVVAMWTVLIGLLIRKGLTAAESRTRKEIAESAPAYASAPLDDLSRGATWEQRMSFSRIWKNRTGSSFIETAILIPAMLMLCCGTMDFARVVYAGIEIASAARAGAQYGALTPGNSGDTAGMAQAAKTDAADLGSSVTASASNFCTCSGSTVGCTSVCSGTAPEGYVSVTANYTFTSVIPYPGMPQSISLSRTAKMRVQ